MVELFENLAKERNKTQLFRDRSVLTPYHLLSEEELVDREQELEQLADYIKKILTGETAKFLLIHGPSGSGKTSLVRFVLRKLQEEVDYALPMYLDGLGSNTEHSLLTECMRFFRHFYEGKGRGSDEIAKEFEEMVKKDGRKPVIVLDNFDFVKEMERVLWRFSSFYSGLILITTARGRISLSLGQGSKASIGFEDIAFKPYDEERLYQMLKLRVKSAFDCPVADKGLRKIAEYVEEKGGNAKIAFSLLLDAGELAQWKGANNISFEHVEEVIKKFERQGLHEKLEELRVKNEDRFKVLKLIAELEAKGALITTGELEKQLEQSGLRLASRTLRHYLEDLERRKFIVGKLVRKGKGRTREIRLNVPFDLVLT